METNQMSEARVQQICAFCIETGYADFPQEYYDSTLEWYAQDVLDLMIRWAKKPLPLVARGDNPSWRYLMESPFADAFTELIHDGDPVDVTLSIAEEALTKLPIAEFLTSNSLTPGIWLLDVVVGVTDELRETDGKASAGTIRY
jgi:hypothetical protein